MTETTNLNLPLLAAGQAQKHVTVNEALARVDALTQIFISDVDVITPPLGAEDGEVFTVGAGATGVWTGQDGMLALFLNGGWSFVEPRLGWQAWLADYDTLARFDGTTWVAGAGALTPHGAGFVHRSVEVDHDLNAGATSSITAFIPASAIVYGITGRVLSDIGGATSIDLGVAGSTDRYGSGIGVGAGAWARGVTGSPLTYYSAEDLIVTAAGGTFDGTGTIRLAVHFAELTLPRA